MSHAMPSPPLTPSYPLFVSGSNGGDEEEFFFSVVSHTLPASTWKFDVRTMTSTKLRQQTVIDYSPKDFRTTQVDVVQIICAFVHTLCVSFLSHHLLIFIASSSARPWQVYYRSKDKTRVPMFIICHKEWVPTANTPALLCGYGGFNASNTPKFDLSRILFIKHFCGIVCVANIRGGGEFGARWHQLGCNNYGISGQLHKQTSVDDFIAAAQFLIAQRYTCSSKLAIAGSSNGGLLVFAPIDPYCIARGCMRARALCVCVSLSPSLSLSERESVCVRTCVLACVLVWVLACLSACDFAVCARFCVRACMCVCTYACSCVRACMIVRPEVLLRLLGDA